MSINKEQAKPQKVLLWIPEGIKKEGMPLPVCPPVELPDDRKPTRLWTLYTFLNKEIPPPLTMKLIHNDGAFIEDQGHEWNVRGGKLIYRSRMSDGGCWVVLEY